LGQQLAFVARRQRSAGGFLLCGEFPRQHAEPAQQKITNGTAEQAASILPLSGWFHHLCHGLLKF
jgi:hypothetical protein